MCGREGKQSEGRVTERAKIGYGLRGTVLVVDDETDIAEELCEFLNDEGFRAILSQSLVDARAKLQAAAQVDDDGIDLVVSDLRMPGGSGTDLIAEARGLGFTGPFILVTGHGEIVDGALGRPELLSGGPAAVMKKPLDIDALLETIDRLIAAG
jgi:DNA-binding NtrC family response regulator